MNKDELKLVYVHKVGYTARKAGIYEFIFSKNPSAIDTNALGWGESPASANAYPPTAADTDLVLELKTTKIDFHCLHEMHDRPYEDGYYTIHCLAYENRDEDANHDMLYDEMPFIVFHYGMKASEVKDIFMGRDLILNEINIADSSVSEPEYEEENQEEEEEEEDY